MKQSIHDTIKQLNDLAYKAYADALPNKKPSFNAITLNALHWSVLIQFLHSRFALTTFLNMLEDWMEERGEEMQLEGDNEEVLEGLDDDMINVIHMVMGVGHPGLHHDWTNIYLNMEQHDEG